jgi:hypothetical protein
MSWDADTLSKSPGGLLSSVAADDLEGFTVGSIPTEIEVIAPRYSIVEIGTSIVSDPSKGDVSVLWQVSGTFWSGAGLAWRRRTALFQDVVVRTLGKGFIGSGAGIRELARESQSDSSNMLAGFVVHTTAAHAVARSPKSPWADAIGPLYTVAAAAEETGLTLEAMKQSIELGAVLAITASEGESLLPIVQFGNDGRPVAGLGWVLTALSSDIIDRYMLASWMNREHPVLSGRSPWEVLREGNGVTPALRSAVQAMSTRFSR